MKPNVVYFKYGKLLEKSNSFFIFTRCYYNHITNFDDIKLII